MSTSRREYQTQDLASGAPIVARLAREFRQRLVELEHERSRIKAALAAIEGVAPPQVRKRRPQATLDARIERILRAEPGMRASMLAEVEGVLVEAVVAQLRIMEQHELVSRDGLGWRLRAR